MSDPRSTDDDPLWLPSSRSAESQAERGAAAHDPSDLELAELERLLGRFAHDGRGFARDLSTSAAGGRSSSTISTISTTSRRRHRVATLISIAACLLVSTALAWWWFGESRSAPPNGNDWLLDGARVMQVGEKFATGKGNSVLELGDRARIELSSGSLVELLAADDQRAHFYLERGRLHAKVTASVLPRFFQVETPAARCVDLGCEFHLSVDSTGETSVSVIEGQIAFELPDQQGVLREVFVPAGAVCAATPGTGLGTPHFAATAEPIAKFISAFDATPSGARDRADLANKLTAMIVAGAERRDSLVLWHLLQDADVAVVEFAERALIDLVGPPQVSKQATTFDIATWRTFLEPLWR